MPATDQERWARVCDSQGGAGYVFRRGIELALELARAEVRDGERWLDVGCGPGHLLRGLAGLPVWAAGVDADPAMVALARGMRPAPPLAVSRAECLAVAGASVDGVTATSVMGCVADPPPVLAEVHRVLRLNGRFIVTFTNAGSWLLRLNYASRRGRRSGGHHLYRVDEARQLLVEAGFVAERLWFYNFVMTAGPRLLPPAGLARRLECPGPSPAAARLARNFIIVARKRSR